MPSPPITAQIGERGETRYYGPKPPTDSKHCPKCGQLIVDDTEAKLMCYDELVDKASS